jgi:hypothetical protein
MSKGSERVKRWRERHRDRARDARAIANARRGGYAPPFLRERDCPPRDGTCGLCGRPTEDEDTHHDHDHDTGAFRGWTCVRCNLALGTFEKIGVDRIKLYLDLELPGQLPFFLQIRLEAEDPCSG